MSKVRDISGLSNIIKTDANGNVTFVSGSTTLMSISSSGAVTSTGTIGGSNSATLATTGSNTFTGQQYVSNTKAPVNFTDTASLYTDGGLRVGKDAYVSGTLYLNDLTVYGTQSINYITSSQLDISDNIITVNTSTPAIRFGGIAVRDSGSAGTGLTGSLLWDSQNNHWVYTNPSGSSYSGGMMISGPRASSLGEEQGTTFNALMKGQGGDHITSSQLIDDGTTVRIPGNLQVTGSAVIASGLTGSSATFSGLLVSNTSDAYPEFRTTALDADVFLGFTNTGDNNNAWSIGRRNTGEFWISNYTGNFNSGTRTQPLIIATNGAATFSSTVTTGGLSIGVAATANVLNVRGENSGYDGSISIGARSSIQHRDAGDTTLSITNDYNSNSAKMEFRMKGNTSADSKLTILGSGNVGIGTSSPLQTNTNRVVTTINGTNDVILNLATGGTLRSYYYAEAGSSGIYSAGTLVLDAASTNNVQINTNGAERMRITSGGNVLIGTTTDGGYPLLVGKGRDGWQTGFINPSSYGTTTVLFSHGEGYGAYIDSGTPGNSSARYIFKLVSGGNERLVVRGDGLMFSPPTYASTTGNAANVYIFASGDFGRSTSSRKYKKNIIDYQKGLTELMTLRPVSYESINEREDGMKFAGLIAEEIEDAGFTEFVQYAEDGTPDAISYGNMIALMTKAIQEQQAQINELKAQING